MRLFPVVLCAALGCTLFVFGPVTAAAGKSASKKQTKGTQPAKQTKGMSAVPHKTLSPPTLSLTTKYCAQSLPYQVFPPAGSSTTATVNVQVSSQNWADWFDNQKLGSAGSKSTASSLPIDPATKVNTPLPTSGQIDDPGGALLLDSDHEFSQNTSDAQRLAIRLMYQPTFSMLPCSYDYLTDTLPQNDKLPGPDGRPEAAFSGPPSGQQPFSLSDYDYYVFDIVHWQDAPAQQLGGGGQAQPPMYQATSDTWYLLNYKDVRDHSRDILTAFTKFEPQITASPTALKFLPTDKVLFIAVHLAPPVTLDASVPAGSNGSLFTPTEQAWYDNVQIQYQFTAKTATPVNVADLRR